MRAIDTNIAARYLLEDEPNQYRVACAVLQGPVFIPITVLLELGWLLEKRYRQPRAVVAEALAELIDLPTVEVSNIALTRWTIARFRAGADFTDMVHITMSGPVESFVTFEKGMPDDAGANPPVPVQVVF